MESRKRQLLRISRVLIICKIHELYSLMLLNSEILRQGNNVKDAEQLSDMVNGLFNRNTSPSDFLHDSNETANKCVEYYNEMREMLDRLDEQDARIIYSLVKELNHSCKNLFINNPVYAQPFMLMLQYAINYCIGVCDFCDLRTHIMSFSLFEPHTKVIDSVKYRRYFRIIEEEYEMMKNKINNRYKKSLKKNCNEK